MLAFTAGILLVFQLETLPSAAQLALLCLPLGIRWRGWVLVAAFVLGMLLCSWQGQRYLDQRWPAERHGETLSLRGEIVSLPERQAPDAATPPNWRFEFAPVDRPDLPARIHVSWYRSAEVPKAGQCWRLTLRLRTPRGSFNPAGFDYEAWLLRERVGATASVVAAQACASGAPSAAQWIQRLRQAIVDDIERAAGSGRSAAMITALAVGHTAGLSDADWQQFRDSGTTHLVAISGFNLGVVSGFSFLLLRWLWSLQPRWCLRIPAQRIALVGSGAAGTFYALLAGFDPPVLRALIMLLLLILAALLHRLQQPSRVLACAWALILAADPFAVLSPGLWLSFGAVAAILFVSAGRLRLPPAWRLALLVQGMLSLALIPLTLGFFGGFAWLAPLANLIAIPIFTVLTPLVLLAVAALQLHFPTGAWLARGLQTAFEWLLGGLDAALLAMPSPWISSSPAWPLLLLGTVGALLLWLPRGAPLRALAVPCLAAMLIPRAAPQVTLELIALDVGQGTAVIVRTARHALLVDAGPAFDEGFDAGRSVVVPVLLSLGITRLDAMLLSHDDNDHAGGIGAVQRLLAVDRRIGTPDGEPCRDGLRWRWDGVEFRVLHPHGEGGSNNNRSCVLRIDGPWRVLLPGDIERDAERRLLAAHGDALAADVLLSPHHGSRTSSTPAFVAAVNPRVVIHSAGWRSRFGHPRAEVVARYAGLGAAQYTTGVSGAITVRRDADGQFAVSAARGGRSKWWHAPDRR
ncbi:MAG TPA: DNA internalization-related competence protein ComEC/Rec2 [Fontimonas sp.]